MSQMMMPSDANPEGLVHGGVIMRLVDLAAAAVAQRHARRPVATVAIDSLSFHAPAHVGDLVTVKASLNDVGRTSMEVGARVEVEDLLTGEVTHVSSAYVVMVAIGDMGEPAVVPRLAVEGREDRRRQAEAKARRARREEVRRLESATASPMPALAARWAEQSGRPLVVAHRGASGHAPENTLASFELALRMGADAIECDVHLSRDGQLFVLHDFTVDRTTNGQGAVGQMSSAELRRLDAGSWRGLEFAGERLPILPEVLDLARGRARVAVELKHGPVYYPGIEQALAAAIHYAGMAEDTLVISFDHPALRRLRELAPEVAVGVLYAARPVDAVALARAADAQILEPQWSMVTAEDVEQAHAAGLLVVPWAVNDPAQMSAVLALGVDGLATDYPDRLLAIVGGGR
jgi:glycerophosphoryl diester phosphodiesterase